MSHHCQGVQTGSDEKTPIHHLQIVLPLPGWFPVGNRNDHLPCLWKGVMAYLRTILHTTKL